MAHLVCVALNTFETSCLPEEILLKSLPLHFDLTPQGIINELSLLNPMYLPTAIYGHFGRLDREFPWGKLDKVQALKEYLS